MKKQSLDPKVFSIASSLFGFSTANEVVKAHDTIAKDTSKALQSDNRIMAVYPAINTEAYALTLENYRKYIANYNFKTAAENELIEKHNKEVDLYWLENKITQVQSEFAKSFARTNVVLKNKSRAYNEKADAFNAEYGLLVKKSKIQLVKYASEIIFANLLHLYNAQLMKRNNEYMRFRVMELRPIQEFKINSHLVTELKRGEINSLDLCKKTVRNHRQRLEECGVFVEYTFKGQRRAVEVHINPEILAVFDMKTSKIVSAENQSVNPPSGKVLPDNNENTGTNIKENQKKDNGQADCQLIRSSLALTPFNFSYSNTSCNQQNKTEGAAAKSVKVPETLSEKLQDLIIHSQELAVNLSEHQYDNYRPIDIRYLMTEAFKGTLTNEEFRVLLIQDFFKSVAKIWRNGTPFPGSWKLAINFYMQSKWISFTGTAFNKSVMMDEVQQMRWRIEWARKWFIKNNFNPLFPNDYFDFTRKNSKEVGFEYTRAKWNEHLQYIKKYDALAKKRNANAARRQAEINHAKKCENEIKRFYKDRITLSQLYEYVEKNLPPEFLQKLPEMVASHSLNANPQDVKPPDADYAQWSAFEF